MDPKIIGLSAACLTMFSFLPQIIKTIKTNSAKDVSLAMLIQLTSGIILWMVYGFLINDGVIILANAVTFITLVILIILYFKLSLPAGRQGGNNG